MLDRRLFIGAVALLAACFAAVLSGVGASADPTTEFTSEVVNNVLPESGVAFNDLEPQFGGGRVLEVSLGQTDSEVVEFQHSKFWSAEVGWRAVMAAAVSADRDPSITTVAVNAGVDVEEPDDSLTTPVTFKENAQSPTLSAEAKNLGSADDALVMKQLDANSDVLLAHEPSVEAVDISPVVLDQRSNALAYVVVVSVTDIPKDGATSFYGNVVNGMRTGLANGGDEDILDGIAVVIEQDSVPLAASFVAARAGVGETLAADSVELPGAFIPSLEFRNVTGGPPTVGSVYDTFGPLLTDDKGSGR